MKNKRAIIYCWSESDILPFDKEDGDFIICADSGIDYAKRVGVLPDVVLGDFDSYVKAWENLDHIYSDKERWNRMSLANIANSAFFSSDRTIREYAEEIWKAL